jgi:glutamate-1-semialdehyde 2,1-aminomutase
MYARFFHGMLERGGALPPSGYEAWFVSTAHDAPALERTLEAAEGAAAALASA